MLAQNLGAWKGTLLVIFQPAEETAQGAQAMIDDGLFDRLPKPEVVLGQHVMPGSSGDVSYRPGTTQAAADSLEVRLFGRGGHGRCPQSAPHNVTAEMGLALMDLADVARPHASVIAFLERVGADGLDHGHLLDELADVPGGPEVRDALATSSTATACGASARST